MGQFILPEGKSKGEYSVSAAQGLKVIVSKVSKTFMFRGVFNGKKISTTLGKYPEMSPDQAINMVLAFQNKLKMGINPIDEIKKMMDAMAKVAERRGESKVNMKLVDSSPQTVKKKGSTNNRPGTGLDGVEHLATVFKPDPYA